jgi:hypothetical protein
VTDADRARVRIEPMGDACSFCGATWLWVLYLGPGEPGILSGCVRARSVAEVVKVARRELCRRVA